MPNVAVLTDSTASIPEDLLERLHIHTVAYYIHRGQEVLRDLVTVQREEFLRWLITARFLPTTASRVRAITSRHTGSLPARGSNTSLASRCRRRSVGDSRRRLWRGP
jgi:hypothetical protein